MRKASLLLLGSLFCTVAAFAQMRVPEPSPAASVSQVVGATKISIDYSSPGVKGREIFGGLLPYDKPWRAGANSATAVTFEDDVTIGGKAMKAGTYSIFVTPKKSGDWTVYFDPSGNSVYNYSEDAAKIEGAEGMGMTTASPQKVKKSKERLSYYIDAIDDNTAHIILAWEKIKLPIEVKIPTIEIAQKSIAGQLGYWYSFASAAKYYIDNDLDLNMAQNWLDMSMKLKDDHFFTHWVMATLMEKKGNKAEAVKYAEAAMKIGDANPSNFYNNNKETITKALASWK